MATVVCANCDQEVWLLRHIITGHRMLVDTTPHADGYLRVDILTGSYVGLKQRSHRDKHEGLYLPHYVTCPNKVLSTRRQGEWNGHQVPREKS